MCMFLKTHIYWQCNKMIIASVIIFIKKWVGKKDIIRLLYAILK